MYKRQEHGLPLTVDNVLASSRLHKRCGTSFLFLVMLVSIFLHFIFVLVPFYWVRLFGRLLMVPVVAGISFETVSYTHLDVYKRQANCHAGEI